MPIFFGTLGSCCQGGLQTEKRVSCANTVVLLVALAALAAAVIGTLVVTAHLAQGISGLGAISELGLPGGIPLMIIGIFSFTAFATLLVKRCCYPKRRTLHDLYLDSRNEPTRPDNLVSTGHATYYTEAHHFFHQEYENRKSLAPTSSTALVRAPTQPAHTQVAHKEGKTIQDLPDEMLVAILDYLDDKDILSFALTNKRHYAIAMDGLLKLFSIRVYLRKEAKASFHRQAYAAKHSTLKTQVSFTQSQAVKCMVPFCAKTMLKETQHVLDTIETIERKTEALRFVAYSLGGMLKADPQIVIPQALQFLDSVFKLGSEGKIDPKDIYDIMRAAAKLLAADLPLLIKCEKYLLNPLLSNVAPQPEQLHEMFLYDIVESLIALDKDDVALKYIEKMKLFSYEFRSKIIQKHLKNNNKAEIVKIITDLLHNEQEKFIAPACMMARGYVFLGEFENACALQNNLKFHEIGHLITAIADQCDPKSLKNLLDLLEWIKTTLASDTIDHLLYLDDFEKKKAMTALIRALTIIIKKIGRDDPIIEELIDKQKDNAEALEMISLCLIHIDLKKACETAEKILDPYKKTTTLITLAKKFIKSNKTQADKLLQSAFEAELIKSNQSQADKLLQSAFEALKHVEHKSMSIVESSLFQIAELYAQIGLLDKAEEIFKLARQEAETENKNRLYAYLFPLVKTYITIEQARKRFDAQKCINLINTLAGTDDDIAFYFVRLVDSLTLYP